MLELNAHFVVYKLLFIILYKLFATYTVPLQLTVCACYLEGQLLWIRGRNTGHNVE